MEVSIQGYVIVSPHNGYLDYTVSHTPESSIEKLLLDRECDWMLLQGEGYRVIEFYVRENNCRKYEIPQTYLTPQPTKDV